MPLLRVLLVVGVLCTLALTDEIIGKFQFDRLCEKAKTITYAGAIPVGYDFYSREGRWLLTLPKTPPDLKKKASAAYTALVKWELIQISRTSEWIPIGQTDTRIFDKRNGVLLASFSAYGTRGGWVSRQFEKPLLVKEECLPSEIRAVNTKILPFQKPAFEPPPEPKDAEQPKPPADQPAGSNDAKK